MHALSSGTRVSQNDSTLIAVHSNPFANPVFLSLHIITKYKKFSIYIQPGFRYFLCFCYLLRIFYDKDNILQPFETSVAFPDIPGSANLQYIATAIR